MNAPPLLPAARQPERLPPKDRVHLSRTRLALAFLIAGLSDGLFKWLGELLPPVEWALDLATALLLFAALGWRWVFLPGLVMEAIPGLSLFPSWVLVVAVGAAQNRSGRSG